MREAPFQNGRQPYPKTLGCLLIELRFEEWRNFGWPTPGAYAAKLRYGHGNCINSDLLAICPADFVAAQPFGFHSLEVGCTMYRALEPEYAARAVPAICITHALAVVA